MSFPLSWSACRAAFGPASTPGLALMQAGCRAGGRIPLPRHLPRELLGAALLRDGICVPPFRDSLDTSRGLCRKTLGHTGASPRYAASAGTDTAISLRYGTDIATITREPPCPTSTKRVLPRVSAQDWTQTSAVVRPVGPAVESLEFAWRSLSSSRCKLTARRCCGTGRCGRSC